MASPRHLGGSFFLVLFWGGWAFFVLANEKLIRRAQGSDLDHGALYMDQRKRAASQGYGYVGGSRFRTKAGLFLYGRLHASDFFLVGEA